MRTRVAAAAGSAVSALSRALGRGSGSVIGGRVLLAVDPSALATLAQGHRSALVSGTNGKTTTTRLLRAALSTRGPVVTNLRGANMAPGLAAALAEGESGADAALEVDEAWLPKVADALHPAVVLLLNLSRDQLDRNNEVRMLAASWRKAVATMPGTTVVANADDPLTAWAALAAPTVVWVAAGQPWTADAAGCPACGGQISFDPDGDGWSCTTCELVRPEPAVRFTSDTLMIDGASHPLRMQLPGRANRANAAMAVTAARAMDVPVDEALAAVATTADVDGRYRTLDIDDVRCRLLLSKNPAGWLEVLDIISDNTGPIVIGINARIADGKDPSWLWDVPFERLRGRPVVASGERAYDLAVRLRYADVEHTVERDMRGAIRDAGTIGSPVDVVGNYTSFMDLVAGL